MGDHVVNYKWQSQLAFDEWHENVCNTLNIPHANKNAATGVTDETAQWTTAYTAVTEVAADDWRAPVEAWVAEQFAEGLGTPCDPPPVPEMAHPDETTQTWEPADA
jgi:hypothetical protein